MGRTRKPKDFPLSFDDIVQQENEKQGNHFYKLQSDAYRREQLSALTGRVRQELNAIVPDKIVLGSTDITVIKRQCDKYFQACQEVGSLPSFLGLSRALGHTAQSLYQYMERHPDAPETKLLTLCRDAVSDALDAAALGNNVNPIVAIFIQKSVHSRREGIELIAGRNWENSLVPRDNSTTSASEYLRRISEALPSDEQETGGKPYDKQNDLLQFNSLP